MSHLRISNHQITIQLQTFLWQSIIYIMRYLRCSCYLHFRVLHSSFSILRFPYRLHLSSITSLSPGRQSFMMTRFLFLRLFASSLLHYGLLRWAVENHALSSSTFIINLISTVAFTFTIASFDMQQLSSLKNLASYLSIHSNFQSSIISSLSFISTFLNTILYIPIARRPRLLKREVL